MIYIELQNLPHPYKTQVFWLLGPGFFHCFCWVPIFHSQKKKLFSNSTDKVLYNATTSSNAVSLLKSLATYCRYLKLTFQFQRSFFLLKNKQTKQTKNYWYFRGGPMVKIYTSIGGGLGLIPTWGTNSHNPSGQRLKK